MHLNVYRLNSINRCLLLLFFQLLTPEMQRVILSFSNKSNTRFPADTSFFFRGLENKVRLKKPVDTANADVAIYFISRRLHDHALCELKESVILPINSIT